MLNTVNPYKSLLTVSFIFIVLFTSAQRKVISGIIKDLHSEEPVPFASISFKNSTIGKLSDSSGHFYFNLSGWPSDTLQITCVGYQPFFKVIDKNKDLIETEIMMERGTF